MEPDQKQAVVHKLKELLVDHIRSFALFWKQTGFVLNPWKRKLFSIVLVAILICFILVLVGILQFYKGGVVILFFLGVAATIEFLTRRHYHKTFLLLRRLDDLVKVAESSGPEVSGELTKNEQREIKYDPRGKTAVLLVNGFNGLGLHTLFSVIRLFGSSFTNFVFLQIGMLDVKTFKDPTAVSRKRSEVVIELDRYVNYMRRHGYYATGYPSCGINAADEIVKVAPEVFEQFPNAIFFGGQLIFPNALFLPGFFHNYTIFAVQKKFCSQGIPVVILPIRVC
jgi:hypothetical protein